ncbi:hypothetical protein TRIUR3_04610 [Triticum urartu]|uniref:Uncharacterized protein n=1 Tax=Triticum urartu TaxID=4572 RepID=M8AJI7_TRIUA|nr:hypothetical protein TRIUR3_04610 [Triticum urartu]
MAQTDKIIHAMRYIKLQICMTMKMKVHQKLNRNGHRGSYEMNQMKLLSGLNQMKNKKFRCIKGDSGLNQMKNKKFRCIKGDSGLNQMKNKKFRCIKGDSGLNQMKNKKFRCIKGDSGLNQMKNKKFRCIKGETDLRRKLFHLGVIMKLKKLLQYKHKKPCQV